MYKGRLGDDLEKSPSAVVAANHVSEANHTREKAVKKAGDLDGDGVFESRLNTATK